MARQLVHVGFLVAWQSGTRTTSHALKSPTSIAAAGPGYSPEQAYSFGELHRAGSTGSHRPLSPMMQIPYQSPIAAQTSYDHAGNGLAQMPTIAINTADAYGVPYRPDSRAQHQHHY